MATSRRHSASRSSTTVEPEAKIHITGKRTSLPDPPKLLRFEQLPEWLQDNPFVQTGYRPPSHSARKCFESLLYLHNESGSIYTHLLPAIFALAACIFGDSYFVHRYPDAHVADRLVFTFQAFTIMTSMALSASFHTCCNHSPSFALAALKLDYVGIMFLTFGNFVSGIYVDFHCEPTLQRIYWGMITLFTLATGTAVLTPHFSARRFRLLRLACFVGTGMSAFAPVIHALRIFPTEQLRERSGLSYYLVEGAILFAAAMVYAARVPESLAPGWFDLVGASHQLFHVLVVVAAGVHVAGVKRAFEYNYLVGRC